MNHKRKKPRNNRAGCKMCKPWKINGFGKDRHDFERFSDHRRRRVAKEKIIEYYEEQHKENK